MRVTKNCR